MPRRKAPWSKIVEEAGIRVRVYERAAASVLYREVRLNGGKDRKSLEHRDRKLAVKQARALARRLAELHLVGHTGSATFGQLVMLYRQHRLPLLSTDRQRTVRALLPLLERYFDRALAVDDLSAHHIEGYTHARRTGAIVSPRHRTSETGVRDGTIRNELHLLRAMIRWGREYRVNGRPLVATDPLETAPIPREQNAMRPIATEARYQALLAVADRAEPAGRFRCVLTLARTTGRRINAICSLHVSDVLLTREQVERALAAVGLPIAAAEHWPHGAIRWRSEHDKKGYEAVAPISKAAREALDVYLRRAARAGDVPLFPGQQDPTKPVTKETAGYWLKRAEDLAELTHMARGGYHAFRRLWSNERRHLSPKDVAAAGGWRSIEVMRESYQHAEAATVYAVIENPAQPESRPKADESGHTLDTPREQAAR